MLLIKSLCLFVGLLIFKIYTESYSSTIYCVEENIFILAVYSHQLLIYFVNKIKLLQVLSAIMKINHYYGDLICILYITLAFQRILLEHPSHGYAYKFRIDPIA